MTPEKTFIDVNGQEQPDKRLWDEASKGFNGKGIAERTVKEERTLAGLTPRIHNPEDARALREGGGEVQRDRDDAARKYFEALTKSTVNFTDARKKLKELLGEDNDFLGAALDEHLRQMELWGLIPEGKTSKEYRDMLLSSETDLYDLPELAAQLKAGKKYQTLFAVERTEPAVALQQYILDAKIPCWNADSISNYTFKGKSIQSGPSIRFTPDNKEADLTGKSANFRQEQVNKGEIKIMEEPSDWFALFRQKADEGLKALYAGEYAQIENEKQYNKLLNRALTDRKSGIDEYLIDVSGWTQFLNYRDDDGDVLCLCWFPDGRGVDVDFDDPDDADDNIGVRSVLG